MEASAVGYSMQNCHLASSFKVPQNSLLSVFLKGFLSDMHRHATTVLHGT